MKFRCAIIIFAVFLFACNGCSTNQSEDTQAYVETSIYTDDISVQSHNDVELKGKVIDKSDLSPFEISTEERLEDWDYDLIVDYFVNIDETDLSDLFFKGRSLVSIFSTSNLISADELLLKEPASIEINNNTFYETGYLSESFYDEFKNVFTEELSDALFEKYPFYIEYMNEVWKTPTTFTGNSYMIHREIDTVNKEKDILEFNIINYTPKIGEQLEKYNPDDNAKYDISIYHYKFVLTDLGWRISECPLMIW